MTFLLSLNRNVALKIKSLRDVLLLNFCFVAISVIITCRTFLFSVTKMVIHLLYHYIFDRHSQYISQSFVDVFRTSYSQFTKKKEDRARTREVKEEREKRRKDLRLAQNFSMGLRSGE